jgi:heterotetrameric sarcosine oxidase gamma subunit
VAERLKIAERAEIQIAAVMARRGVTVETLSHRLGLPLPTGPKTARCVVTAWIGVGPGVWLAMSEAGQADWANMLREELTGLASVSEQSAGYAVLRMAGPDARLLLQKGAYIDLDPTAFGVGDVAVTHIAHMGVILWQVDDAPTFDVAVFRSLTGSFHAWIAAASGAGAV